MSEETILRKHCRLYLQTFRARVRQGFHAYYAHKRADAVADAEFHLTAEERQKRDAWLDSKLEFRGWRTEPAEDRGRSLFDDESIMGAG